MDGPEDPESVVDARFRRSAGGAGREGGLRPLPRLVYGLHRSGLLSPDPDGRAHGVSAAKALTAQLGRRSALAAIQLHGAMGMTEECRASHYAKRLIAIGQMFGDAGFHLRRVASRHSQKTHGDNA